MKSTHVSLKYRISVRIFLLLTVMVAITAGLRSGYANEVPLQGNDASSSKAAAPSLCGQIGFSNNIYSVGYGPSDLKMGDLNGDSKIDLVTANYNTDNTSVLLGNGNGTFMGSESYASGDTSSSIAIADFFGDRIDDLAVANTYAGGVSYLQGEGDGTFFEPYSFDMDGEPSKVALGDFNGDSFPDIATSSGGGRDVTIRLNDGVGDFAAATHIGLGVAAFDLVVGDFNSDGKIDLATTNLASSSISVLIGNGNGTFQAPINFGTGNYPLGAAIGDVNGDGKTDIVTANRFADNVAVLIGNGDGLFQTAAYFAVGTEPYDVAVGDFNDDGKADLVSANKVADSVTVLLGSGNGSFYQSLSFSAGDSPESVVAADFNGDGKNDIATGNLDGNNVSVKLNTCALLTNTPTPTSVPLDTSTPTNTPLPTQTSGGPTATPQACAIQFTDVAADNTFYPFVRCLACRGIISGYACGGPGEPCNPANDPYFRPSSPVTRGQLAKIVSNSAGFADPVSGQTFEDVVPGSAFYTFVERLVVRDVMGGYACGGVGEPCGSGNLPYFRPGSGATRAQLTKIVANAAGFTDPAPGTFTFTDVAIDSTFHVYVERLLMNRPGIMGGYDCGGVGEPCDAQNRAYFRPANPLTRGQTSKIVGNAFYPNCQTPGW